MDEPSGRRVRVGVRFMLPDDRTVWQVMPGTTKRTLHYAPVDSQGLRVNGPARIMPLGAALETVTWL